MGKIPPDNLLKRRPSGIIFGKASGMYVVVQPDLSCSHTLVIGGSGSGKTSSVLLDTLLAHQLNQDDLAFCMIDVKGELEEKGWYPRDENLRIFNPTKRGKGYWGFDVFYDLSEKSTPGEVLIVVRRVVFCMIQLKLESKDGFWIVSARVVVTGIWVHGWVVKGYRTLPELADYTLSKNLKALINEILGETEEGSIVAKLLASYGGENAAEETLSSIAMNIAPSMQLLATDETLRYLFRDCGRKRMITPEDLEKGISIDLQVPEEYLQMYQQVLSLVIGSVCTALTRRPEGSNPVVLVLDELGRIACEGQIEGLQQVLQVGRSRGVSVLALLQSWAALEGSYSKAQCTDMLNNFAYRLILSAAPDARDTVEMAVKAFGKYTEQRRSYSRGKSASSTVSFEEKDIIWPSDLLELPAKGKAILLSPQGAFMIQKLQYFRDHRLNNEALKIQEARREGKEEECGATPRTE
ncbi:MAG: type IV secretory system conjugative DNA transfer family protein [Lachnospiraceae bacterium]|nr:type IV secretory system conjugative DNA transfer family protein [Lachnospiraceae bacterium]